MAEISHTWEDAAACSGVVCKNLGSGVTKLTAFHAFDEYQADAISLDEYLSELAKFVGCAPEEALKVHNGILVVEYPGVLQLVEELRAKGYRLGCLSNTNAPHWEVLALNGQYPAINSLEMKMASHQVGLHKLSDELFDLYRSRYCLRSGTIVFFDDAPANVEGAVACGWNAKRIDPSMDTPTQMREYLSSKGML